MWSMMAALCRLCSCFWVTVNVKKRLIVCVERFLLRMMLKIVRRKEGEAAWKCDRERVAPSLYSTGFGLVVLFSV